MSILARYTGTAGILSVCLFPVLRQYYSGRKLRNGGSGSSGRRARLSGNLVLIGRSLQLIALRVATPTNLEMTDSSLPLRLEFDWIGHNRTLESARRVVIDESRV